MHIEFVEGEGTARSRVHIILSARNLKALLAKLDIPTSQRTILQSTDKVIVTVEAEDDWEHYVIREGRHPGPMHPETERIMVSKDIKGKKLSWSKGQAVGDEIV